VRSRLRTELAALAAAKVLTVVTVLLVWARNRRFFYRDDVEHQMMGAFRALHENGYGIGDIGGFRRSWALSLVTGEIQFGVFNPLTPVRDAIASMGDDLARNAMLIALLYLLVTVTGAYVAARAVRIPPALAVAASLFVTFNVHLLYWNAGSWTPALIGFAWFSWFVAAVWWTRRDIRFAVTIPVSGFFLVTAGWPHAMIAAGVVALIVGVQQLAERSWGAREAVRYAAACLATALLTAPTWVSAQLFADWAARAPHGLFNDGFLTHHLDAVFFSWSPFSQPYIDGFAGQGFMFEPITYIAWFLPLAAYWVATSPAVRRTVRVDLVTAAVVCVGTFGPSILGPTRWPFRFQPFAAFLVVMVAAQAMHAARDEQHDPRRFTGAWKWIAPVAWLALTAFRPRLYPMFLTVGLLVAIALAHRMFLSGRRRWFPHVLAASVVLTTVYLVMASPSPAMPGDRNTPSSRSAIARQYAAMDGQRVLALQGDLAGAQTIEKKRGRFRLIPNPEGSVTAAEMADGNVILASGIDVEFVTGYSAMPHEGLEDLLRTRVFGWSTEETAKQLFATEPTTGRYWIDLLGVTQLFVQRGQQQQWLDAALPRDYALTKVTESAHWVLWGTENKERLGTGHAAGGKVVLARPLTPGLRVAVDGTDVPVSSLAGALPVIDAAPTAEIEVRYVLPRGGVIAVLMLLGGVLFVWLAWGGRRRTGA
jgi:hypothetical protein